MVFSRPLQAFFVVLIGTAAILRISQVYYLGNDVLPKAPKLSNHAISGGQLSPGHEGSHRGSLHRAALVELSLVGLRLPLRDALDASFPLQADEVRAEEDLLRASARAFGREEDPSLSSSGSGPGISSSETPDAAAQIGDGLWGLLRSSSHAVAAAAANSMPHSQALDQDHGPYRVLRMLIAVTSTCCSSTSISAARRQAARSTWVRFILQRHNNTHVRFVLAQPAAVDRAAAVRELTPEAQAHNDLLVVRGAEEYKNLPNKTLRLLRYALSSPARYTHVLKTDDDCYVRLSPLVATLRFAGVPWSGLGDTTGLFWLKRVYTGCLENPHGFYPLRNEDSKWHISYEEMPDEVVPWAKKYLAGWGYMLSHDLVSHIVSSMLHWERHPEEAPGWYSGLHWEDVLIGLIAGQVVGDEPQADEAFVPAWKRCTPHTAVRHLDVEAPEMFAPLYEQEVSGTWAARGVACSRGDFEPDNYWSWKGWRDSLTHVQALGDVG